MAEMLDTCQSNYANLESGKSNLSVDRLLSICEILDTDVHHLLDTVGKSVKNDAPIMEVEKVEVGEMRSEVRQVYEQFISELRSEVDFLRSLVRQQDLER
jgi:transcriptional regulator with XRE-family HTH domain